MGSVRKRLLGGPPWIVGSLTLGRRFGVVPGRAPTDALQGTELLFLEKSVSASARFDAFARKKREPSLQQSFNPMKTTLRHVSRLAPLLAAGTLFLNVASAQTLLTFDSPTDQSTTSYAEDGFLVLGDPNPFYLNSNDVLGDGPRFDANSAFRVQAADGSAFDFISLVGNAADANTATWFATGTFLAGGTIFDSIVLTQTPQAHSLSGFVGLSSIQFSPDVADYSAFDSFTVAPSTSAVPEPSSYALWIGALGFVFCLQRRGVRTPAHA